MTATLLGNTTVWPTVEVSVAFTSTPGDTSTWTDVTAYVRGLTIKRGRQDELGRVEAGTLSVLLSNSDGRFDPTYSSSPYYPYVLPMRQIRVRAVWSSVTYNLFRGYVERWPMTWPASGFDDVVSVVAVDAFKVLNLATLNAAYAEALASARVTAMLDDAGIETDDYSVATASHTLVESGTLTGSALEHISTAADSEGGLFFVDGGGTMVFQQRNYRYATESSSRGTVGDSTSELNYRDIHADFDDTYLRNRSNVTWQAGGGTVGGTESYTDTSSTATYGIRGLNFASQLAYAGEAAAIATYNVYLYAQPALRFPAVAFEGAAAPSTLWPHLLGSELSRRYTIIRRPSASRTITKDVFVEGVEHSIGVDRWVTVWNVSPAPTDVDFWVIGTSVLGTSTIVGY